MPALGGVLSTTSVALTSELAAHEADTTAIHGITDTAALATAASVTAHTSDTSDAHDASAVSVVPFASIAATDVQAALEEIVAEAGGGGIPQGGPLTEDLLAGGFAIVGAAGVGAPGEQVALTGGDTDDGGMDAGQVVVAGGGNSATGATGAEYSISGAGGSGGGSILMRGGDGDATGDGGSIDISAGNNGDDQTGGTVTIAGGDNDDGDTGAELVLGGGTTGVNGRIAITTNAATGDALDVLTAQGDGTALWAPGGIQQGGPFTEDFDADGFGIHNLAAPAGANDPLRVADLSLGSLLAVDNDANTEQIKNLADPTDPQDAATKAYVDDHSARHEDGGADEISLTGLAGTPAALTTHEAASDPHTGYVREADASWIDLTDGGATTLHSHAGGGGLSAAEVGARVALGA